MRTANNNLVVVLVMMIGAAATWLWINRGVAPPTSRVPTVTPTVQPQQPVFPVPRRRQPELAVDVVKVAPAPVVATARPAAIPAPHVDATYQSMLVAAQTKPDNPRTEHDLLEERERFLATADDPDWARRTEQALWEFYQAQASKRLLQVTSVACRSQGCEVQAAWALPACAAPPCELALVKAGEDPDPIGSLRGDWPGGLPLRRQLLISQPIDAGPATLITYSREDPPAAASAQP